jgi:pyruvate,water dikinase
MSPAHARELIFTPPGEGFWELDPVHFPRPVSRYWREIHPAAFRSGTADFASAYGLLFEALEMAYVHGFAYRRVTPLAEAELPGRFRRAEEVFGQKFWRQQLQEWNDTVKPAAIAAHRQIQAMDPDALSDDDLAGYLQRCRDHHAAMLAQHMRYTAAAIVPTGDFLAHAGAWTGLPAGELLGLMRGTSPVSAGASDELAELIAALQQDPPARDTLETTNDPAAAMAALRTRDGRTGLAMAAYLDLVGNRLLDGFDITNPRALELPDVLLRAIRAALTAAASPSTRTDRSAEVRALVPEAHRDAFDALLAEARLTYPIRDARGVFSDIWAAGLMRRAAQAAGRRLAARGLLHDPGHIVDAGFIEMLALLGAPTPSAEGAPSADELAERAAYRGAHDAHEAPPSLGPTPPPPPDPSTLPPAAARMMQASGLALQALFVSSEASHEQHMLRGLAASPGVYEGPVRRVSHPSEFDRIQKGDVLVTQSTTEAFNILLPLLGGIVTDRGGLLSHSAIVAREYGIPGVVGTREASRRLDDGQRVRVDGTAGEVTVLP